MTENLKHAIDRTASDLRTAKFKREEAEKLYEANEAKISDLVDQTEIARDKQEPLRAAIEKAVAEEVQAYRRYQFYTNEAIVHPYDL